jgi:hypothetical protein
MDTMASWCPRCVETKRRERAARTVEKRAPGVAQKTISDVLAERRPPRPTKPPAQDYALRRRFHKGQSKGR